MNSGTTKNDVNSALASIVETFEPAGPRRFDNLTPFKEEIRELRARGASFVTIAEILKRHAVKTSRETIRRFYREAFGQDASRKKRRRNGTTERARTVGSVRNQDNKERAPRTGPAKADRGPRIARIEDL